MSNSAGKAVLDVAILTDMYGDDSVQTVCPVLTGFRDEATSYIAQIKDAATKRDCAEMARLSHSLKSMCGLIGASQLMHWCQTVEHAARQHDLLMLTASLQQLDTVWAALLEELTDKIQRYGQANA